MTLSFSKEELVAVFRLGMTMASADGIFHENEKKILLTEMARFGVRPAQMLEISELAKNSNDLQAMFIVSLMNDEQKRYVCAYLAVIMASDGDLDEKEMALWQLVTQASELPEMSLADAIKYMQNL